MRLRTKIRLVLAIVAAVAGFGFTATSSPASAVCGGGLPGEPCYCPGFEISKQGLRPVYC
ncbi:MAG TPA: hypothetical protein VF230_02960 [Acidimicrobiales bacterium]